MKKHSLIRTIYLYLFALVGLALIITGTVRFIDMGLKAYVFTKAEDPEKLQRGYLYVPPISISKAELYLDSEELAEEEIAILKEWLADYKEYKEREEKVDYLVSKRHREASNNLALLLVGIPLYLYHWRIIRKETKNAQRG